MAVLRFARAALLGELQKSFGARVVCTTSDIIELRVEDPPQSRFRAATLAREQFLYCPDVVYQGFGTMKKLTAQIMGSHAWAFWWH